MDEQITIDCGTCTGKALNACGDCVVTFIMERDPDDALIIDAAEARAVRRVGRGSTGCPEGFCSSLPAAMHRWW